MGRALSFWPSPMHSSSNHQTFDGYSKKSLKIWNMVLSCNVGQESRRGFGVEEDLTADQPLSASDPTVQGINNTLTTSIIHGHSKAARFWHLLSRMTRTSHTTQSISWLLMASGWWHGHQQPWYSPSFREYCGINTTDCLTVNLCLNFGAHWQQYIGDHNN